MVIISYSVLIIFVANTIFNERIIIHIILVLHHQSLYALHFMIKLSILVIEGGL